MNSIPIIIDTDAGTDDLLALAYLLSVPGVVIEAVTVVHGLAHVREGARNIRGLLHVAGRDSIPVFAGDENPLEGSRPFPAKWRTRSDNLPGVDLPLVNDDTGGKHALEFLRERLKPGSNPVRILALGPLTHFARVASPVIHQLVVMGGAVSVPGNLASGNPEKAVNEVAEWNIYVDPHAAEKVFASRIETLLVPLDATNRVPVTLSFVEEFRKQNLTELGRVVDRIFGSIMPFVEAGTYFAWDPLAAMALLDESIVTARRGLLEVATSGSNIGQTKLVGWNENSSIRIAVDADTAAFDKTFRSAFVKLRP